MFELIAAILSGVAVAAIAAALGGGGSILSVPLLIYFVGIGDAHAGALICLKQIDRLLG